MAADVQVRDPIKTDRTSETLRGVLTPKEAAAYVGLSASTLAKKRVTGLDSPPYVQSVPNGVVRYRVSDLDDWMEARVLRSTSDRTSPSRAEC